MGNRLDPLFYDYHCTQAATTIDSLSQITWLIKRNITLGNIYFVDSAHINEMDPPTQDNNTVISRRQILTKIIKLTLEFNKNDAFKVSFSRCGSLLTEAVLMDAFKRLFEDIFVNQRTQDSFQNLKEIFLRECVCVSDTALIMLLQVMI